MVLRWDDVCDLLHTGGDMGFIRDHCLVLVELDSLDRRQRQGDDEALHEIAQLHCPGGHGMASGDSLLDAVIMCTISAFCNDSQEISRKVFSSSDNRANLAQAVRVASELHAFIPLSARSTQAPYGKLRLQACAQ